MHIQIIYSLLESIIGMKFVFIKQKFFIELYIRVWIANTSNNRCTSCKLKIRLKSVNWLTPKEGISAQMFCVAGKRRVIYPVQSVQEQQPSSDYAHVKPT